MTCAGFFAVFDKNLQFYVSVRCRLKGLFQATQIASHECEKIAGLRIRVFPGGGVGAICAFFVFDAVTVGEQNWIFGFLGCNAGLEAC